MITHNTKYLLIHYTLEICEFYTTITSTNYYFFVNNICFVVEGKDRIFAVQKVGEKEGTFHPKTIRLKLNLILNSFLLNLIN